MHETVRAYIETVKDELRVAGEVEVRRKDCDAPDEELTAKYREGIRAVTLDEFRGRRSLRNRCWGEPDPTTSTIPGARADWAPSQAVTYEPDLGEDLEISSEEERAWRTKR